jgi:hypothetical protein
MDRSDLDAKYCRISPDVAEPEWQATYDSSLHHCMHGAACTSKGGCQVCVSVCDCVWLMHQLA